MDKLFVMEVIRDLDEAIDLVCEALSPEEQRDPFAEDLCPYFGILWAAAEGLSQFIAHHPDMFKKKSVLELGCGLGYPSLVATAVDAKVLATDFHPDVETYFKRNLRHSNLEASYQRLNWREEKGDIGLFDIVMGSDVLYESKHPQEVVQGLARFLKPKGKIILSDPGRAYLQTFVTAMKSAGFRETLTIEAVKDQEIFVFVFERSTEYTE
jgi:predicted nicotinamide N-methyase